ncbi:hypothetical protein [Rhizobium grahamii]|uniref:hypothetical protein n=1 Tax=Rhizobium grahamii TaxID=1120045 RepID=UPI001FD104B7|nr:hypothetical protein [Rhizobium grahamii]
MAIYLGVSALIEDDWKSHRTQEFRNVQAAKAIHRLASGTHRNWEVWSPKSEDFHPLGFHAYPRSSGHVLRKIGGELEEACGEILKSAVPEIIRLRTEMFGEHPSHLPGQTKTRLIK